MFIDNLKNKSTTADTHTQQPSHAKQTRSQIRQNGPGLKEILGHNNSQSQMYVFNKKDTGKNQVVIANLRHSPDDGLRANAESVAVKKQMQFNSQVENTPTKGFQS
jgi:5,10-methylene-tetrahydrofolate dehydrogenase/methenyl tetrahydrofolate cyclohydrolase